MDQLDRIAALKNTEMTNLSVYFKNEDNGKVNLGYISPVDLFEIEHLTRAIDVYYRSFRFSVMRQFLNDTVYYKSENQFKYEPAFVKQNIYAKLSGKTIQEIRNEFFINGTIMINDEETKKAIQCYLDRQLIPTRFDGRKEYTEWNINTNEVFSDFIIKKSDGTNESYSYDRRGKIVGVKPDPANYK